MTLAAIGRVRSPLAEPREAPTQGFAGAPDACLEFSPEVEAGLQDLRAGEEVLVLTWLDRAGRGTLRVHPRDDPAAQLRGVFAPKAASLGLTVEQRIGGAATGTMLRRLPTLATVAETVAFLASEHATAMTATVVDMTAGLTTDCGRARRGP